MSSHWRPTFAQHLSTMTDNPSACNAPGIKHTTAYTEDEPMASIEDAAIKHEPGVFIKPEPTGDNDLEYLFDGSLRSPSPAATAPVSAHAALSLMPNNGLLMSVRPNPQLYAADRHIMPAPNSSLSKIKQADGTVAPTICNENIFALHPHHHRLNCGHDIMTEKPEGCAINCHLGTNNTDKPTGAAFVCPHPHCKHGVDKLDKAFISVKAKGYRKCILSHVYGIDLPFDSARLEEKAQMAAVGRPNEVAFKTFQAGAIQDRHVSKRSVSPDLNDPATRVQQARRYRAKVAKRNALLDPARGEDEGIQKYGLEAVLNLKRMQTNVTRNNEGRVLTARELQAKRTAKVLKELQIDGTEAFRQKSQGRSLRPKLGRYEVFARTDEEFGFGQEREWPHAHLQGYFDGEKSIRNKEAGFHSMPSTTLEAMRDQESGVTVDRLEDEEVKMPRDNGDVDFDDNDLVKHCICQSIEDDFMLQCGTCAELFHPICVGENLLDESQYDGSGQTAAMRKEAAGFRKSGKVLTCVNCHRNNGKEDVETPKVFDEQPALVQPMQQPEIQLKTRRELKAAQHTLAQADAVADPEYDEDEEMSAANNRIRTKHRTEEEKALGIHPSQGKRTKMRKPELKILQDQAWATAAAKAGLEIAFNRTAPASKRKREASVEAASSPASRSRASTPQRKKTLRGNVSRAATPAPLSATKKARKEPSTLRRSSRRTPAPTAHYDDEMED